MNEKLIKNMEKYVNEEYPEVNLYLWRRNINRR